METTLLSWGLSEGADLPRFLPEDAVCGDYQTAKKGQMDMMDRKGKIGFSGTEWSSMTDDSHSIAKYQCNVCSFGTDDFMNFITHKNGHSDRKEKTNTLFTCGMCDCTTPNAEYMVHHIQSHIITSPLSTKEKPLHTAVWRQNVASRKLVNSATKNKTAATTTSDSREDITVTVSKLIDYVEATSVPNLGNPLNNAHYNQHNAGNHAQTPLVGRSLTVNINSSNKHGSGKRKSEEEPIIVKRSKTTELCEMPQSTVEVSKLPLQRHSRKTEEIQMDVSEKLSVETKINIKQTQLSELQSEDESVSGEETKDENAPPQVTKGNEELGNIANDALIGYLQLRRVKPVELKSPDPIEKVKPNMQADIDSNQLDNTNSLSVVDSAVMSQHKIKQNKVVYGHNKPVLVRFCANKNTPIIRSHGVKTVKPQVASLHSTSNEVEDIFSANKIIKPNPLTLHDSNSLHDSNFNQIKGHLNSANDEENAPKQLQKSSGIPRSSKHFLSSKIQKKRLKKSRLANRKLMNNADVLFESTFPLLKTSTEDTIEEDWSHQVETNENMEATSNFHFTDSTSSNPNVVNKFVDMVESQASPSPLSPKVSSTLSSTLDSSVCKKPKNAILLRYQEELSREQSPVSDTGETANIQVNSSKQEAVEDIECSSQTQMRREDDSSTKCNIKKFALRPCKVVLTRCPSTAISTSAAPNDLSSKLKSSLMNYWWKVNQENLQKKSMEKPIEPCDNKPNSPVRGHLKFVAKRSKLSKNQAVWAIQSMIA